MLPFIMFCVFSVGFILTCFIFTKFSEPVIKEMPTFVVLLIASVLGVLSVFSFMILLDKPQILFMCIPIALGTLIIKRGK